MTSTLLRRLAAPAILAALALPALAACNAAGAAGNGDNEQTRVQVGETELGDVLLDSEGKALYMFKNDSDGESACYADCEKQWPPLIAEGDPSAGTGADADLLGTIERTDGFEQVTYKGMPLYHFAKDTSAGSVKGQGVKDLWYVVDAEGSIVEDTAGDGGQDGYGDEEDSSGYDDEAGDGAKPDIELAPTDEYGDVLVDSEGMTLYMFFKDENLDNASACNDDCLDKWTPMTLDEGEPALGEGLSEDLAGTIERTDGSTQVTYNDWPLYTYVGDEQPGDTKGVGFQNLWCATDAEGKAAKQ